MLIALIGLLLVVILILVVGILKLRSDLYTANWLLARLVFLLLVRGLSDVEVWDVIDHATLMNFVEGHMTLADFYLALRRNL